MKNILLKDLVSISSNLITSRNQNIKIEEEVKELRIGMIKSRTKIENTDEYSIQEKARVKKILVNDIIIKRVSPIFTTLILNENDLVLGANLLLLRLNEKYKNKIYPAYLSAYIDFKMKTLVRTAAAMPTLVLSDLQNLSIPIIDFKEQETIGNAWVENDLLYISSLELAEERNNYNINLLFKNMEEL